MRRFILTSLILGAASACGDDAPQADTATLDTTAPDTAAAADTEPADTAPPDSEPADLATPDAAPPELIEIELTASEMRTRMLDITLPLYAYNTSVPGPTIEIDLGDEVLVHFVNDLPEATTIHWHGLRIPDWMDGNPRIQAPVEPGQSFDYRFIPPEAGTFWYHPHLRGNEQIEKGLYGAFIVHERERPNVDADRVIFVDDILLDGDGFAPFLASHMEEMHGRLGNTLLTNGRPEVLELAAAGGQVERWRLINPANARTMSLSIEGARWRVVGTDGGLIETPYATDRLELAVGQRYDLEVTYETEGTATLTSHVLSVAANGDVVELGITVAEVAVGPALGPATEVRWPAAVPLPARETSEEVVLELNAANGMHGFEWTINGAAHSEDFLFRLPQGTTASIVLFNRAGPEHPFHLHGQFFEIVRRNAKPVSDEPGLKDTVLVPGMESVELRAYLDNPGLWMAHCHILEHMELGMMAQFEVSAP